MENKFKLLRESILDNGVSISRTDLARRFIESDIPMPFSNLDKDTQTLRIATEIFRIESVSFNDNGTISDKALNTRWLIIYSRYFDVTIDWLIGIRESASLNNDFAAAVQMLDLDDKSLQALMRLSDAQKEVLCKLCEPLDGKKDESLIGYLLNALYIYCMSFNSCKLTVSNSFTDSKEEYTGTEANSLLKSNVLDSFALLLNEMQSKYADQRKQLATAKIKELELEKQIEELKKRK